MTHTSFYHHSLSQLIEFLASSTQKLIGLMNQKGTGILVRHNRNEIDMLKDLINNRRQYPGTNCPSI